MKSQDKTSGSKILNKINDFIDRKKLIIQILLFVTAILFILYGVFRDELYYVFNKAINICFECIGLG